VIEQNKVAVPMSQ